MRAEMKLISKKYFLFIILSFSLTTVVFPQASGWYNQPSGSNSFLNDIYFFDEFNGILVGSNGTILHTIDGGNTWNQINSSTEQYLYAISFINGNIGWIVGTEGTILKTTNSGLSWTVQNSPTSERLESIWIIDENNVWIVGFNGTILRTSTGGTYWELSDRTYPDSFRKVQFTSADTGWIGAYIGLYQTTNSGLSWTEINNYTVVDLFFWNQQIGWLSRREDTGDTRILKTIDGGLSWESQAYGATYHKIFFRNELKGWIVGYGGEIKQTINGGENWVLQESNTTRRLLSVFFVTDNIGWTVGEYGTILKTITGGITDVNNESTIDVPTVFSLSQNFPNPFNPTTKIKYAISKRQYATLKVFDVLGNEVASLVNEEKPAGSYEVKFSATDLPSGVYLYRLQAGSLVETKKMILLR